VTRSGWRRLARAGELTAVRAPNAADEAVRDLVRAREEAVRECRNARHRPKALLLRSGIMYSGKSAWTAGHLRWLALLGLMHLGVAGAAAVLGRTGRGSRGGVDHAAGFQQLTLRGQGVVDRGRDLGRQVMRFEQMAFNVSTAPSADGFAEFP